MGLKYAWHGQIGFDKKDLLVHYTGAKAAAFPLSPILRRCGAAPGKASQRLGLNWAPVRERPVPARVRDVGS